MYQSEKYPLYWKYEFELLLLKNSLYYCYLSKQNAFVCSYSTTSSFKNMSFQTLLNIVDYIVTVLKIEIELHDGWMD